MSLKNWGGAPGREGWESREMETFWERGGNETGQEGKEMVGWKWGWGKREIPGRDRKYKGGNNQEQKEEKISSACLPDGHSLCPLGDKKLEDHQRALRSGPPRARPVDRVTSQMLITLGFFHQSSWLLLGASSPSPSPNPAILVIKAQTCAKFWNKKN